MLDPLARRLIDPPLAALAERAAAHGIGATTITLGGFGLGLVAILLVAVGASLAALPLLLLNRLADGLDGAVARRNGVTDLGGYLDIVLDFIIYSGFVFGFAVLDPAANALAATFLLWAFMGTGSSFLAFAIMAAKRRLETTARGHKSFYYLGGLTEGTETILFLALCCLVPSAFPIAALVFGVMCWLTTLGRMALAWRSLR